MMKLAMFIATAGICVLWMGCGGGDEGRNEETADLEVSATPASTATAPPTSEPRPSVCQDGNVLITRTAPDGASKLLVLDADGSVISEVGDLPKDSGGYACSPDDAHIAFLVSVTPQIAIDLYVAGADGSGIRKLTQTPVELSGVNWSPDSTRIMFASRQEGNWEIYVLNVDAGDMRNVSNNPAEDIGSDWSPDGTRIVFSSNRGRPLDFEHELYVIGADGSGLTQLTALGGGNVGPSWSPDGSRISFTRYAELGGSSDVYVANSDGSSAVNLTNSADVSEFALAWSPQRSRLMYSSSFFAAPDGGPLNGLYYVDLAAPTPTLIIEESGYGANFGVWSPDGARVAFPSYRDGSQAIYVVNLDGSGLARLASDLSLVGELVSWAR